MVNQLTKSQKKTIFFRWRFQFEILHIWVVFVCNTQQLIKINLKGFTCDPTINNFGTYAQFCLQNTNYLISIGPCKFFQQFAYKPYLQMQFEYCWYLAQASNSKNARTCAKQLNIKIVILLNENFYFQIENNLTRARARFSTGLKPY